MQRAILAALAVLFWGGSSARAEDASVQGVVAYQGKPCAGTITFHRDNKQFVGSAITEDGKYEIDLLRPGRYKVTVEGKDIPAKYKDAQTTPLAIEVKPGKNATDVSLE
jgi:hypothetical protein